MSTTETTVNWDILSLVLTILIIILTARNSKVESADLEWFVKREVRIGRFLKSSYSKQLQVIPGKRGLRQFSEIEILLKVT